METHKYNNTVIQSKGSEHGKRIIEWWKAQGVDTRLYEGDSNGYYYGLIDSVFDYCKTLPTNTTIIELPEYKPKKNVHRLNGFIYITNDEEIKIGDLFYLYDANIIAKYVNVKPVKEAKKIILTNDPKLIKDGVQAINDESAKWLVENTSCDLVEVEFQDWVDYYKIFLSKEEPKQATSPQIIDLSNVEGVKMMVSDDGENWFTRKIIAKRNDAVIDSILTKWYFFKPIEVKKVTMKEVEKMFGCMVEIVKED
jgi:hypothetical protein